MISQKKPKQNQKAPHYTQTMYVRNITRYGGMSQNEVHYSSCTFYKLHKYQHKLNVWVSIQ